MAKIKLTLPLGEVPVNGKQVTFVAPCDCSAADGIQIDGVDYDIVDSIGRTVPFGRGVWDVGAVLTVVLDVTNHKAYLQNQNAYTRYETLTHATAALFGLGTDAVPDDVLGVLSTLVQHWWQARTSRQEYQAYAQSKGKMAVQYEGQVDDLYWIYYMYTNNNTMVKTMIEGSPVYSDSISMDSDGNLSLVNPQTITFTENVSAAVSSAEVLRGKYYKKSADATTIYYIPQSTTFFNCNNTYYTGANYLASTEVHSIGSKLVDVVGEWEYVQSPNRNEYPDEGVADGYEYKYLGIPRDKAIFAPKIATGSYIGTGTYNSTNPLILNFSFLPKLLIIRWFDPYGDRTAFCIPSTSLEGWSNRMFSIYGYSNDLLSGSVTNFSGNHARVKIDGTNLYISASNSENAMNVSDRTYYYIAIG